MKTLKVSFTNLADSGTTKGVKMARHNGAEVMMAKSFQSAT